ncbi:MAG: hypothetical protein IPF46_06820 [Saprospiraceae bacterium]|nr:hypothetical protein [Candidatus Vicinibacter affinis]
MRYLPLLGDSDSFQNPTDTNNPNPPPSDSRRSQLEQERDKLQRELDRVNNELKKIGNSR